MRFLALASLLTLLCAPNAVRADETLNLELPSSKAPLTTPLLDSQPGGASRMPNLPNRGGANPLNSRKASMTKLEPKERTVGRLGVVKTTMLIRRTRGERGAVIAKVPAGTYLALTGDAGTYYGVLMSDRTTGWIPKTNVSLLNYEVVAPETPATPRMPGAMPNFGDAILTSGQRSLLQTAYSHMGIPYVYGGTSVQGIDCSAFVQRCFSTMGIRLPRTAHEQFGCGMPVPADQMQAGDRVYFSKNGSRIDHTGLYLGNGYFIHASSANKGVVISSLSEDIYTKRFMGARR